MNRKLLIGIIVVIIGLVIAAAIYNPLWIPLLLVGVAPIVIWIYLVWIVRKEKAGVFHTQMEPELAERRLRRLKLFLRVGGISFVVFVTSVVLHNVVYALFIHFSGDDFWERTGLGDEPVFFTIALISVVPFAVGTIGGLVIFLKGRRKPIREKPE